MKRKQQQAVSSQEIGNCKKGVGNALELTHLFGKQDYHSAWASPEAFSRYVEDLDKKKAWHESGWELDNSKGNFYGTKNMDDALDLAQNGWKEGADQVEALRRRTLAANPLRVQPVRYDIAGSFPNVPRAVSGNIMNMRTIDLTKSRKRPILTLVSDMSCHCGISKDAISNRAAVVAAIIDQVEAVGYTCEVLSIAPTKGGYGGDGFKAQTSVLVKDAGQPADTKRLAFGLGHSSMFRRMIFADWGTEPSCKEGLGYSLGHGGNEVNVAEANERHMYVLPSAGRKSELFETPEKAATEGLAYMLDQLRGQNCPPFKHLTPLLTEPKKKRKLILE